MDFLQWKLLDVDSKCTENCFQWSNSQTSSIGSDNGLAPIGRRAIIRINNGLIYKGIDASFGLNELKYIYNNI